MSRLNIIIYYSRSFKFYLRKVRLLIKSKKLYYLLHITRTQLYIQILLKYLIMAKTNNNYIIDIVSILV